MSEVAYVACALLSLTCALLLLRRYRSQRSRLLLFCTLGFAGFALNNALVVVDLLVVPEIDLSILRTAVALIAMSLLVVGMIWESR